MPPKNIMIRDIPANEIRYQVFHLPVGRRVWQRTVNLCAVLSSLFVIAITLQNPDVTLPMMIARIPLAVAVFMRCAYRWLSAGAIRLVISSEGIEYHSFGYSMVADWKHVGAIEEVKNPRSRQVSRYLSLLDTEKSGSPLFGLLDGAWALRNRIPIDDFGRWEQNEMGNALRRYAPYSLPSHIRPHPPARDR
jgi:hypothetical protein